MRITFIDPNRLRPHEKKSMFRLVLILIKIVFDRAFKRPILVDQNTLTILDGHHRVAIAKLLRLRMIPAMTFDYMDNSKVIVQSRRKNMTISKDQVLAMVKSGNTFPKKTTKHVLVDSELPNISIKLSNLYTITSIKYANIVHGKRG